MPKFAQSGSTDRLKPLPDAVISTCKGLPHILTTRELPVTGGFVPIDGRFFLQLVIRGVGIFNEVIA